MSNALAVAAVTTTLRSMLARALEPVEVTSKPLDEARQTTTDQLNLFLYQVELNGSLRNSTLPGQVKPGETGQPPLALNLFYLVTAYGSNNEDGAAHQLLGRAMSLLHDRPLLDPAEIQSATDAELPGSDLHTQVERVRVTPQPLGLEEMSKLWATFQTQFRISAAYQVSVVLIESKRETRTPLPALGRGTQDDSGVASQPDLTPSFPVLTSVETPDKEFGALLGQTLVIKGFNLDGANASVRLSHPVLDLERVLTPPDTHTANEITVTIPNQPANFPAGFWTAAIEVTRPGETFSRTTNRQGFALAPEITTPPADLSFAREPDGLAVVTLDCRPSVHTAQRASLLLGAREIVAEPRAGPGPTDTLVFNVPNPRPDDSSAAVESFARLRVDGVDSILVDRTGPTPVFRDDQKVTIT